MKQNLPITPIGFDKLQKELDQLIKVEREDLKIAINEARELGDLKENAEYHSAKEKQGLVEGRISQLQSVVANAQVIDPSTINSDKIVFGATVKLFDIEKENSVEYKLVGQDESDFSKGLVSYNSPLGKALIGREEGDTVIVKAPKGDIEYEIEKIEYK